jgi:hypothetical protein
MLGIPTRDTAHRGESAYSIGSAHCADAAYPGLPVSCVGGVELVAASDPMDRGVFDDCVVDGKRVFAGDFEDVVDTNLTHGSTSKRGEPPLAPKPR